MKIRSLPGAVTSLALMTLFGCGGGGGGGTSAPAVPTVISGVVAKGPVNGAEITVYAVKADGTVDRQTPIGTGKTAADGTGGYAITLNPVPAGPVVVEAIGGTYTDEASRTPNVKLTATLRTIISSIGSGSDNKIAVTPLTELAYKKAEGLGTAAGVVSFTKANIDNANNAIQKTFGIDNIITSLPFDPTIAAPAAVSGRTVLIDDKRYSAALGAFSQMAASLSTSTKADDLSTATVNIMTKLESEVHDIGSLQPESLVTYNAAVDEFNAGNLNQTGIQPTKVFTKGVLTINTSGDPGAVNGITKMINGIELTITLPAGVTVKTDAQDVTLAGVVLTTGLAAGSSSYALAKFTKATGTAQATLHIMITNVQPGFGIGEFLNVNFDGFPSGNDQFILVPNSIEGGLSTDINTSPLPGVSLTNSLVGL